MEEHVAPLMFRMLPQGGSHLFILTTHRTPSVSPIFLPLWRRSRIVRGTLALCCPSHAEVLPVDHHRQAEPRDLAQICGIDIRLNFDFSGLFKASNFEVRQLWDTEDGSS